MSKFCSLVMKNWQRSISLAIIGSEYVHLYKRCGLTGTFDFPRKYYHSEIHYPTTKPFIPSYIHDANQFPTRLANVQDIDRTKP